jgi:hypothetical protein
MNSRIFTSIIRVASKESKATGKAPLWLRVHFSGTGKRKQYSLSPFNKGDQILTATKEEWNEEFSRYKDIGRNKSDPRNQVLVNIENSIEEYEKSLKGKPFTLQGLERAVFTFADDSSFKAFTEAHIKALEGKDRYTSMPHHLETLRTL